MYSYPTDSIEDLDEFAAHEELADFRRAKAFSRDYNIKAEAELVAGDGFKEDDREGPIYQPYYGHWANRKMNYSTVKHGLNVEQAKGRLSKRPLFEPFPGSKVHYLSDRMLSKVGAVDVEFDDMVGSKFKRSSSDDMRSEILEEDFNSTSYSYEVYSLVLGCDDEDILHKGHEIEEYKELVNEYQFIQQLGNFESWFCGAIVDICSHLLAGEFELESLEEDFRDGIAFHTLVERFGFDELQDLPHPEPEGVEQMMENWESILCDLHGAGCLPDIEGYDEFIPQVGLVLDEMPELLANGSVRHTALWLITVLRKCLLGNIEFEDRKGCNALNFWLSRFGMSLVGASISSDHVSKDQNTRIADSDNLRDFIAQMFPHLSPKMEENWPDCTNEEWVDNELEELDYCMDFIKENFGVPKILYTSTHDRMTSDCLRLHDFLQAIYAGFLFWGCQTCTSRGTAVINDPVAHVNHVLRKYRLIDNSGCALQKASKKYYEDLQSWIGILKGKLQSIGEDDSANKLLLLGVRQLIGTWMGEKIRQFSKIYSLTALFQSNVKQWCKSPATVCDPRHSIPNLEKCFETVLALHRRIEVTVREVGKALVLEHDYKIEFKKKQSRIKCWIKRWESAIADVGSDRFNAAALSMRLKLLHRLQYESEAMKEELSALHVIGNSLKKLEVLGELELDRVFEDYEAIETEFETFIDDVHQAMKDTKEAEEEARELDCIYYEQATLMEHLNKELEEFYAFFSSRPPCNTPRSVAMMRKYVKEAWDKLFGVASEIDSLLTLQTTVDKLKSMAGAIPLNCYTGHTVQYSLSHYEKIIMAGGQMEEWLNRQEKSAQAMDDQLRGQLNTEVDQLVENIFQVLSNLRKETFGQTTESQISVLKDRIELAIDVLKKQRDNKGEVLFELARPLHQRGIITPRVSELVRCWDYCLTTLQLMCKDVDSQLRSHDELQVKGSTEAIVKEYYSHLSDSLLLTSDALEDLLCPEDGAETPELKHLTQNLNLLNTVDPYGRVTCSMFLEIKRNLENFPQPVISATARQKLNSLKKEHLTNQLRLLSDGKPYMTSNTLKYILSNNTKMIDYATKQMTEYFGCDTEELRKEGIKCYDYERFVCQLLGLHKKLPINPDIGG